MRFLHSSDWQLGLAARQLGEKASEAREYRFSAAARVVDIAVEREVDFVVLAGDTFDSHEVDADVVQRAVELFEKLAPRTVFLLPGNHDPLGAGSVWESATWLRCGEHVRLLERREEVEVGSSGVLYPCPLAQKRSRLDPTEWIPSRGENDERVRVGVAHGSLGVLPTKVNFPIAADRCEHSGLDYLALGDWHGLKRSPHFAYPGTIEATRFSERDTGYVLVVDIDPGSREVELEAVAVGELTWVEVDMDLRHDSDVEALAEELGGFEKPEALVVRALLRVDAQLAASAREELDGLRRRLERESFFVDWRSHEITPLALDWPPGTIEEVGTALDRLVQSQSARAPFSEFSAEPSEVLMEARALLRRLAMTEVRSSEDPL